MRRTMRLFVAMLTLTALLLTLGVAVAQDKKILYTGRQMGPDDIPTLDPSRASDVPSVNVIAEIFPELYRLHEENVTTDPGMATVSVSEDGLTYTFSILPEVSWVKYNPGDRRGRAGHG
ncbi:MAG: hypothetical protein IPK52_12280 [Chloroflexi bacterium]|nr:hypothetical protein [Chloroflexota bacterium]